MSGTGAYAGDEWFQSLLAAGQRHVTFPQGADESVREYDGLFATATVTTST